MVRGIIICHYFWTDNNTINTMKDMNFYHMFANGADVRDFILSESDFIFAFNLVGVCAANTDAMVVAFSIEDTHPHILLFGSKEECIKFKLMYERAVIHHISKVRCSIDRIMFKCELYPVTNEEYLRNVAVYCIIQPTKDGKGILPYDYMWGTGSMYFRPERHIPIWWLANDGTLNIPVPFCSFSAREKKHLLKSKKSIPDEWLVCNGIILPSNYVDVERFEEIFGTPNCYRVFLGNSKNKDDVIDIKMAKVRGVSLSDMEARSIAEELCHSMFGKRSARWIGVEDRIELAVNLRRTYQMSIRQIATLVRLPEEEVRNHFK